ncbi:SRPBCC family protein [Mucilaginibacter sp. RS28]|uniref:SRPBCC family protein n=1 Tax=Mucilaginibacter straminoryzae TaxID=2932774 RepID=A0A9X1X5L2_9SPHI|nr:SRPBCC family protein [Mucilaginibacter straminoryzae]MCJ8211373.1 SRPBCC family protein [Mucilaginibacter straminoryzae]
METSEKKVITVETEVNAPIEKVWELWSKPEHITQWCVATPEWHTPYAENDLREGGRFMTRMEAKDGSFGFDLPGTYTKVKQHELIAYTMDDDRKVVIQFSGSNPVKISESFEAEQTNPIEMQQLGWQAILDNFKKYAEAGN